MTADASLRRLLGRKDIAGDEDCDSNDSVYDFDDEDDDDDRDVNLCSLMMTRQTTWSVFGSNL